MSRRTGARFNDWLRADFDSELQSRGFYWRGHRTYLRDEGDVQLTLGFQTRPRGDDGGLDFTINARVWSRRHWEQLRASYPELGFEEIPDANVAYVLGAGDPSTTWFHRIGATRKTWQWWKVGGIWYPFPDPDLRRLRNSILSELDTSLLPAMHAEMVRLSGQDGDD